MSMTRTETDLMWLAGGAGLVALLWWQREAVSFAVSDVIGRGKRLTATKVDADGVIRESPAELAAIASAMVGRKVSPDDYALARMIRSEGAGQGVLRAHVAYNDLEALGWSGPLALITYSTVATRKGRFGTQISRRYSSAQDPYEGDLVTVDRVKAERLSGIDPTEGAIKFVDRSAFGVQVGTGSYAALVQRWAAEGLRPFEVAGAPSDFVVFRRVG